MNRRTIVTSCKVKGHKLTVGTEFSVRGERGRFSFRRFEIPEKGSAWITAWGGAAGREAWRSFDPARVSRVYRPRRAR